MKYKIEHREELVGYFEVEADDEALALDVYERIVSEGKVDYGDMEMVDSSDKLIREEFKPGQECHFAGDVDHKEKHFVITRIYDGIGKNVKLFDAIRLDGSVLAGRKLELIYRTGRYFPIVELLDLCGGNCLQSQYLLNAMGSFIAEKG